MSEWDAIGVGLVVRDISVLLDRHPSPDEKLPAREIHESGGGPVPTALVTLQRLGSRTAIASTVGNDAVGRLLVAELNAESVDTRAVVHLDGLDSPTSVILVENGRRTILEAPKGVEFPLAWETVEKLPLDHSRALLIDARSVSAQLRAAKRVRKAGGLVVLDCGHPRPGVEELVAVSDIAIFSHTYPKRLYGESYDAKRFLREIGERLPRDGPGVAGVTLGAKGCIVTSRDDGFHSVAGRRVDAVDTTGAGDVFHGAFIHAFLSTGSARRSAEFANFVAAEKCKGMTGRAAIPSGESVWSRL